VEKFLPCISTHEFASIGSVSCSSVFSQHGNDHQSTKTYSEKPRSTLLRWFGVKEKLSKACRWEGAFEPPANPEWNSGWLLQSATTRLKEYNKFGWFSRDKFWKHHYTLLKLQGRKFAQFNSQFWEQNKACFGCLLNVPAEKFPCGHLLCTQCCLEQQRNAATDTNVTCFACDPPDHTQGNKNWKTQEWSHVDIPNGAGFRVLSIDGGGVRGVLPARILWIVEAKLGIPINRLFDFIIGTSAGGLGALAFGKKGLSGEEVTEAFKTMGSKAFKKISVIPPFFARLLYGYKYERKALHSTLASFLDDRSLFSTPAIPKIAVRHLPNLQSVP
jgi:Patatin-like phospholipase